MRRAERSEKFIAIVGLPRSGTTLLTALLDAHPLICLYYEPWNASPQSRPPVPGTLADFRSWMQWRFADAPSPNARMTGFKETTTNPASTNWAVETVSSLSKSCDVEVVWIQRDPIHCLLSKLDGAKKWWGHPDARLSRDSLEAFVRESYASYETLDALIRRHGGLIVRYEALAREPRIVVARLMSALGESFDEAQLDYYLGGLRRDKVMGDPSLIDSPGPVTFERVEARRREADRYRSLIDAVLHDPELEPLARVLERGADLPAVSEVDAYLAP